MVGMNVSGIVSGKELKLVAQEIFTKASSQKAKAVPEAVQSVKENPFESSISTLGTFVPQETKTAKTGFQQSTVEMNEDLKKSVNSQAAIDKYGLISFKTSKKEANAQPVEKLENNFEVSANKKDKQGKNPFAFFVALPKNGEEALKDDKLDSIFGSLVAQNQGV
jgi:hypothetical protein